MKNFIGAIVFILALFLVFNMTVVTVTDLNTGNVVSFAKAGYFYADEDGKSIFLGTILNNRLKVSRIGYKDKTSSLPLTLFKRTANIQIEEDDYQALVTQLSNWSANLNRYKYTFSTSLIQNGKTEIVEFDSRKIGNDSYFVTKNTNNGVLLSTNTVISIGNNMYISNNGEALKGPLSEEDKQAFISKNITFLSLDDVISGSFIADEPQEINFNKNIIEIVWSDANTATINIDKYGNISEIDFSQVVPGKTFKAILKIDTVNVEKISVSQDG
jgi:hypothetical protein